MQEETEKALRGNRDSGHGERASFQPAGVSAVSPHDDDRQVEKEMEKDKMEEEFMRVFADSTDERKGSSEKGKDTSEKKRCERKPGKRR